MAICCNMSFLTFLSENTDSFDMWVFNRQQFSSTRKVVTSHDVRILRITLIQFNTFFVRTYFASVSECTNRGDSVGVNAIKIAVLNADQLCDQAREGHNNHSNGDNDTYFWQSLLKGIRGVVLVCTHEK